MPADLGRTRSGAPQHLFGHGSESRQWPTHQPIGGKAFADFMVAPETQMVIRNVGVEKFGQSLFLPVAGKREDELGA